MSRRTLLGATTAALLGLTLVPASSAATPSGGGGDRPTAVRAAQVEESGESANMRFIANLQYNKSGEAQNGSDIEFMRLGQREFALAGTLREGLQIINITDPRNPRRVAVYDCAINQGDVQVWRNGGRVLASYTADSTFGAVGAASDCGQDLKVSPDQSGTVIVDLTRPRNPSSVSFIPVAEGSHNMTIHPSGKYLYNSNSDLLTAGPDPAIAIFDVSNPRKPEFVRNFPIPFVPTSLGSESHDITFSKNGNRAYSAALSQTLVLDTSNPRSPSLVSQIVDPQVNVSHGADPVTLRRADGSRREVLIVSDERAGAAGSVECPGGGLHLYDITGELEKDPQKIGSWYIDDASPQDGATCTAHVMRIYPQQKLLTIAWYVKGVRVLDISGLADFEGPPTPTPPPAFGEGSGMREIGNYVMPDADTWSFKTNKIRRNGSFFGYGNDMARGFDVYRFNGKPIGDVPPLKPRDLG